METGRWTKPGLGLGTPWGEGGTWGKSLAGSPQALWASVTQTAQSHPRPHDKWAHREPLWAALLRFHNWSFRTWPGARGLESSFPSPTFAAIKCKVEGPGTGPALWGHQDCQPAFQPPGGRTHPVGLMCLGFVRLGLEGSSNCPFLWGLVGNVPKSLSKEEKQTAESSRFQLWDIFQDTEGKKKNPGPKSLIKWKAMGCRKEWELLHNLQLYQGNLKIHPCLHNVQCGTIALSVDVCIICTVGANIIKSHMARLWESVHMGGMEN